MRKGGKCPGIGLVLWSALFGAAGCVSLGSNGHLRYPEGGYVFDGCAEGGGAKPTLSFSTPVAGKQQSTLAAVRERVAHFGAQSYTHAQVFALNKGECFGEPQIEIWLKRDHTVDSLAELSEQVALQTATTSRIVKPLNDAVAASFSSDSGCQRYPGEIWPVGEARDLVNLPQCLSLLQQRLAQGDAAQWRASEDSGYCTGDPKLEGKSLSCFAVAAANINVRDEMRQAVADAERAASTSLQVGRQIAEAAAERFQRADEEERRRAYEASPEFKAMMQEHCQNKGDKQACWAAKDFAGLCAAGEKAACDFNGAAAAYDKQCLAVGEMATDEVLQNTLDVLIVRKIGARRYRGIVAGKPVHLAIGSGVTEPSNVGEFQAQLGDGIRRNGIRKVRQDNGFDEDVLDITIGDSTCVRRLETYSQSMRQLRESYQNSAAESVAH